MNNLSGASPSAGQCNVISGNEHNGVRISGSGSSGNQVAGNNIGTGEGGMPLGNYQGGIRIENGASNNVIGSSPSTAAVDALMANTIAWNGGLPVGGQSGAGVAVVSNQAVGNSIRGNSIYLNGGLGIDLGDNGVTPPNSNVGITGPNNLQNFPIITNSIVEHAGTSTFTVVWGSLYTPPTAPLPSIFTRIRLPTPADTVLGRITCIPSRRKPMARGSPRFGPKFLEP